MSDENKLIEPKFCPICEVPTNYVYRIESDDVTKDYYRCQCGVVFQEKFPYEFQPVVYDKPYREGYQRAGDSTSHHAIYTYGNLIEELTYGRTMLDVGMASTKVIKEWERRGWITNAIDINQSLEAGGNIHRGDFETYDFNIKVTSEMKEMLAGLEINDRKFDMLWMSHVLEHFKNPRRALEKAYNLLSETGVLFIATPDIDFIFKTGVSKWPHWKPKEHYILWSEGALVRELERVGFNVILKRRNFSSRYIAWWDNHIIAQKRYF